MSSGRRIAPRIYARITLSLVHRRRMIPNPRRPAHISASVDGSGTTSRSDWALTAKSTGRNPGNVRIMLSSCGLASALRAIEGPTGPRLLLALSPPHQRGTEGSNPSPSSEESADLDVERRSERQRDRALVIEGGRLLVPCASDLLLEQCATRHSFQRPSSSPATRRLPGSTA